MIKNLNKKIIILIIVLISILVIGLIVSYLNLPVSNKVETEAQNIEKEKLNQIYYTSGVNSYDIFDLEENYITTVRTIEEVEFYSNNPDFNVGGEPINTEENEILTENIDL